MAITPQVKRLFLIFNEYLKDHPEGNQASFARLLGINQGTLSRTLKGEEGYPIGKKIIDGVCLRLGYSATWFMNGVGEKKANTKTSTLVEVQMLRAEIAILRSELDKVKTDMRLIMRGKPSHF